MSIYGNSSAGVYINETDISDRIQAVSTSIGAIVGQSNYGPVNQRTLITSTRQFLETFGKPDAKLTFMHYAALAFLAESQRLYVTRVAKNARYGGIVCRRVGNFNVSSPFTIGYDADDQTRGYTFDTRDLFIVYAKNPGAWNNELSVIIKPVTANVDDNTFIIEVYRKPSSVVIEKFTCTLNMTLDGYGKQLQVEEQINATSKFINVLVNFNNAIINADPTAKIINSLDGHDFEKGFNGEIVTREQAYDMVNIGWDLYSDPEEITFNIMINGGYADPSVQLTMDSICNRRKDCIAIFDVPSYSQELQSALDYRGMMNIDSSYSALYSPDLFIVDEYNSIKLHVPPSGHVAAIYALTDRVASAWNAPAGMNRGGLAVLGLRQIYDQGARDALDGSQINALRVFYGAGIKVWGSSTLQTRASALSEISVRRLMIMLEQSIAQAALYSVFEQNDRFLRARLTSIATGFLEPIKRGNGIYAYRVVCDDTNNTSDIIANGDTILDVYIDPALPVKRIQLSTIIAKTGAIAFSLAQLSS